MTDDAASDEARNVESRLPQDDRPDDRDRPLPDFASVVRKELSYVWNTLRRLGVHPNDLNDQVQEVFLTVHHLLPDYDPARPLRPWLFAIAYRIAGRYRHKRSRDPLPLDPGFDAIDSGPNAEVQLAAQEGRALVMKAIQAIPIHRRAVFLLAELDELPVPDIAQTLGIPLNTAYSRLRVAREEFAAAAERLHRREEGL